MPSSTASLVCTSVHIQLFQIIESTKHYNDTMVLIVLLITALSSPSSLSSLTCYGQAKRVVSFSEYLGLGTKRSVVIYV